MGYKYVMYVHTRVAKKPENLKPDPTGDFDPLRVPDPKKTRTQKGKLDPTRTRNFGFGFFRVPDPKTRSLYNDNLMGGSRRETPIEIDLRDFRRRRQSRKSIIIIIINTIHTKFKK